MTGIATKSRGAIHHVDAPKAFSQSDKAVIAGVQESIAGTRDPKWMEPIARQDHEDFCQLCASGSSMTKAYDDTVAKDKDMTRASLYAGASRLSAVIGGRIQHLRALGSAAAIVSASEVVEGLRRVIERALDKDDLRSANGALRSLGDSIGLFRQETHGPGGPTVAIQLNFNKPNSVEVIDTVSESSPS